LQDSLSDRLWRVANSIEEVVTGWPRPKDHVLPILFVRFLSDWHEETLAAYRRKYKGDAIRVGRAMRRERFVIPDDCTFEHLCAELTLEDLGERINTTLRTIEQANLLFLLIAMIAPVIGLLIGFSGIAKADQLTAPSLWKNQRGSELRITSVNGTSFRGTFTSFDPSFQCQGIPYPVTGISAGLAACANADSDSSQTTGERQLRGVGAPAGL